MSQVASVVGHHLESGEHEMSFIRKYIFSTDHKTIGKQYLLTGVVMAIFGGALAIFFRINLANPGFLTDSQYNAFVTYHGAIMFFWVAMPILLGGFGNMLIPLMIGARDMAFPTLNMISFWTFFLSSVVLVISFFVPGGAFSGGWTVYPPLSADPERFLGANLGTVLFLLALALEFASMLMGGGKFHNDFPYIKSQRLEPYETSYFCLDAGFSFFTFYVFRNTSYSRCDHAFIRYYFRNSFFQG